jgi:hypothetical protein
MVARLHTDRRGNETKGDPAKVNAVADHIKKNPLPCADLDSEKDQDTMDKVAEYVRKFNAKFPLLSWDYSRICLAATIFPHYVPGAKAAA